jgi:hypothetical protein
MQVLVDDAELKKMQGAAKRNGLTLAEWVRQVLRRGLREEPSTSTERKLAAIRSASRHSFPTADVDEMLAEIERGYGDLP